MAAVRKTCSKCKKSKAVSSFYRDKSRKDGRYPYCKLCQKALNKDKKPDKAVLAQKAEDRRSSRRELFDYLMRAQNYKCGDPFKDPRQKGCGRDFRPLIEIIGEELVSWLHIDHIKPRKDKGSNESWNLQVLCPPCNVKHDR